MTYWPGTKIPKSTGDAFDWRNKPSQIASDKEFRASNQARMNMAGASENKARQFTIYSRAKASK